MHMFKNMQPKCCSNIKPKCTSDIKFFKCRLKFAPVTISYLFIVRKKSETVPFLT